MNLFRYGLYYAAFFTIYAVFTPNLQLFLSELGFGYKAVGFLQGIYQVAGIAGPLIIGRFADKTRRYKHTLLLCLILTPPMILLLGYCHNFWAAVGVIALVGLVMRPNVPLSDALVSHSVPNPQRDYGRVRPAGSLGFLVAAIALDVTGVFKKHAGGHFITGIFITSALTIAVLIFLPRATRFSKQAESEAPEKIPPFFWLVFVALFMAWLGQAGYFSFYSLYLVKLTTITNINIQWAIGALFEIPFLFFSGYLIKRWGYKPLMMISLITLSLRMVLYALVPPAWVLTASQMLHSLTFGLLHAVGIAFVNHYMPQNQKGLGMALYAALMRSGSGFIGSMLGGIVAQKWGLPRVFWYSSIFPIIAIVILLFWREGSSRSRIPAEEIISLPPE